METGVQVARQRPCPRCRARCEQPAGYPRGSLAQYPAEVTCHQPCDRETIQPARPRDPRTGTPAQPAQPPRRSRCARNDRAAHQANNPMNTILTPASEQRATRRETATRTRQPATTTPAETQQRPYAILRNTGKSPQCSVETSARAARLSEPLVGLRAPAGWGPAAQHWTAYVWMRQHLREIRSAPKAVLAHAAPARGIVHVSRRVLPNGRF